MRQFALQTLTWGTVTAAVTSALWLAATEPGWPESRTGAESARELRHTPPERPAGVRPAPAPRQQHGAGAASPVQRGEPPAR